MTKPPSKIIAWADHNGPNYITRFDCQGEPEFTRAEYTLKDTEAMRDAGYVPVDVLGVNADLVNKVDRLKEQLATARNDALEEAASFIDDSRRFSYAYLANTIRDMKEGK